MITENGATLKWEANLGNVVEEYQVERVSQDAVKREGMFEKEAVYTVMSNLHSNYLARYREQQSRVFRHTHLGYVVVASLSSLPSKDDLAAMSSSSLAPSSVDIILTAIFSSLDAAALYFDGISLPAVLQTLPEALQHPKVLLVHPHYRR
jgi:hypothetical protein